MDTHTHTFMENIHVVGTMPNTCPCPQGDGGTWYIIWAQCAKGVPSPGCEWEYQSSRRKAERMEGGGLGAGRRTGEVKEAACRRA